eukprot:766454-Hanusia_phi.AAC.15
MERKAAAADCESLRRSSRGLDEAFLDPLFNFFKKQESVFSQASAALPSASRRAPPGAPDPTADVAQPDTSLPTATKSQPVRPPPAPLTLLLFLSHATATTSCLPYGHQRSCG